MGKTAMVKAASKQAAKKAGKKAAAKAGAKAGARAVPYLGQILMFVEGAPIAIEEIGNLSRAEIGALRRARRQWGEGRRTAAMKTLFRQGVIDRNVIIARGTARTAVAAFLAREAANEWTASSKADSEEAKPNRNSTGRRLQRARRNSNSPSDRTWTGQLPADSVYQGRKYEVSVTDLSDSGTGPFSLRIFVFYGAAPFDAVVKRAQTLPFFAGVGDCDDPDECFIDFYPVESISWAKQLAERALGVRLSGRSSALARKNPDSLSADLLIVLAHLRALQWLHWTTHWTASGPNFYGVHLMLERLYAGGGEDDAAGPDIQEQIDALGERIVAYFGATAVNPVALQRTAAGLIERATKNRQPLAALLELERSCQKAIRVAWKSNQKGGPTSLGLDDYLMALANERDTAVYLLQQTLQARPNRSRAATAQPWMKLAAIKPFERLMQRQGVSEVARSPRGFLTAYRRAGGDPRRIAGDWPSTRAGFISRHMAQVRLRNEPLWTPSGDPTRRHLALIAWAYTPDPDGVVAWLEKRR